MLDIYNDKDISFKMNKIMFYNSMTKQKEEFKPISDKNVLMYSCGPTVYNLAHIGNLRAYIFSDILNRVLLDYGYNVRFVVNLTDVDDKTIKNSIANKMSLKEYTNKYSEEFFKDIKALHIKPASSYPAATDHIKEMLEIIEMLEKNGHTYVSDGSVYFKISTFKDYGKLTGLDKQTLKEGASGRVSADEYEKENASDFVLWKAYTPEDGEVYWESKYGKGRPGWHIECSAMSSKHLAKHFDIHTGGIDNKFPHHENEIAQNECAFGETFVNYWLHCEHLIVDGEKMSKSKGNFYTLRDLLDKGYNVSAIRYLLLSSHYRKQLNFTTEGIDTANSAIDRVNDFAFRVFGVNNENGDDSFISAETKKANVDFSNAIYDDLNISEALGVLFTLVKNINASFDKVSTKNRDSIIAFLTRVNNIIDCFNINSQNDDILDNDIEKLIAERIEARANKNYKKSDEIRDLLLEKGIELLDTKDGTKWKRK